MDRHTLISVFKNIILADFKTAKKKFLDQGIEEDIIDTYLDDFKTLKDRNKIKSLEDKNIDNWAKKTWDEFVEFIDSLKKEKSKSEEIKELKKEGAELVAEDDNWRVYKITTYEASRMYGSGKWCITRDEKWWKKYNRRSQFYFILSKTRPENDKWNKIAVQVKKSGKKIYWDATDKNHSSLPSDLRMVKYEALFDKEDEDISVVERLIDEINDYAEDQHEWHTDPELNDNMTNYLWDQEFDLREVDDDLKERLEVLEKLADKLGKDYNSLLADACNVEYDDSYYPQTNEISRITIGTDESEVPEDIKEEYESLTEEEKEEVNRGIDSYFDGTYVHVGSESQGFVAILDEEKVENTIKELSENLKVHKHENTPKIDLLALKGKNVSTRKLALEKTQNQNTIEKAYLDDDKGIRKIAASKMKDAKLLSDIAKNTSEDDDVRIAAIGNPNFTDQDYLKKVVSSYKPTSDEAKGNPDSDNWKLYTTSFAHIKDIKWCSKYIMKPKINESIRETFVVKLAEKKKNRLTTNDINYLKKLTALMVKEKQVESILEIIRVMPEKEQDFFKKLAFVKAGHYHRRDKPAVLAMEKITDEVFLKNYVVTNLKKEFDEDVLKAAIAGINDQEFLKKLLNSEKVKNNHDVSKEIVLKIDDEKLLVNYAKKHNSDIDDLAKANKFKSDKAKLVLIADPKIYDFYKRDLIAKSSKDVLKKAFLLIKKSGDTSNDTRGTLRFIKEVLGEDSPVYDEIEKYLGEILTK
jgi:hypothetical protein